MQHKLTEKYISLEVRIKKEDITHAALDDLNNGVILQTDLIIDDGIHITRDQQKKIYALYNDFSEYTGYKAIEAKQYLKELFCVENRLKEFSVASEICTLKQASEFIDFIIDFFIQKNIPLTHDNPLATKDIKRFMYYCVMSRTCCVTGKRADIHHVDTVGIGRDRTEINHVGLAVLPLCREKHTEVHQIGLKTFLEKYHVLPIKLNKKMVEHLKLGKRDDENGTND